jgi:hypothetical protein
METPDEAADRVAREVEEEARTASAIYGLIVGTAVMASAHSDSAWQLSIAVLVTLLIYWAAERYAHLMAKRIIAGRPLSRSQMLGELSDGWELVTASFLPLIVLDGARVLGAGLTESVLAALICSTGLLAVCGWRVGSEAELSAGRRLGSAAIAGAFGIAMIVLKAFPH